MQANESIILDAAKNNWMYSICYWYRIKILFKSGVITDYSLSKLSKLLNISSSALAPHIAVLKAKGLIVIDKENKTLTCLNAQKISGESHLCTIRVKQDSTIHEIKLLLYSKVIEQKISQTQFILKLKKEKRSIETSPKKFVSKKTIKKLRKHGITKLVPINERIEFTDDYFAKLLNISRITYNGIKQQLNKLNIINYIADVIKVCDMSYEVFKSCCEELRNKYGVVFYSKGAAHIQKASTYFLSNKEVLK
jgi:biotin operon repressor